MKLVEIVAVYPPYRGGIGTVAQDNVKMAADEGWDVTVCTPSYHGQYRRMSVDSNGTQINIIPIPPLVSYGNAAVIPGIISYIMKADCVHVHYPFLGTDILAALASRILGKRLIVTYHMDLAGKGIFKWIFSRYTTLFLPIIVSCADRILVTSMDYAVESRIKKYLERDREKYTVMPCAVDTVRFTPSGKNRELLTQYGLTKDHTVILFVGGLDSAHYFKGVDLLIDAFAFIAPNIPQTHLIIVGDGNLRKSYEQHAARTSLSDRIHFAGSVSDDDLPCYYASADVTVLPSLDASEAFGIALIESMACGTPVISSHTRGVRSVVRDGSDGILISPGSQQELVQALAALLSDGKRRMQMGDASRNRIIEHYSYDRVKKIFQEILKSSAV